MNKNILIFRKQGEFRIPFSKSHRFLDNVDLCNKNYSKMEIKGKRIPGNIRRRDFAKSKIKRSERKLNEVKGKMEYLEEIKFRAHQEHMITSGRSKLINLSKNDIEIDYLNLKNLYKYFSTDFESFEFFIPIADYYINLVMHNEYNFGIENEFKSPNSYLSPRLIKDKRVTGTVIKDEDGKPKILGLTPYLKSRKISKEEDPIELQHALFRKTKSHFRRKISKNFTLVNPNSEPSKIKLKFSPRDSGENSKRSISNKKMKSNKSDSNLARIKLVEITTKMKLKRQQTLEKIQEYSIPSKTLEFCDEITPKPIRNISPNGNNLRKRDIEEKILKYLRDQELYEEAEDLEPEHVKMRTTTDKKDQSTSTPQDHRNTVENSSYLSKKSSISKESSNNESEGGNKLLNNKFSVGEHSAAVKLLKDWQVSRNGKYKIPKIEQMHMNHRKPPLYVSNHYKEEKIYFSKINTSKLNTSGSKEENTGSDIMEQTLTSNLSKIYPNNSEMLTPKRFLSPIIKDKYLEMKSRTRNKDFNISYQDFYKTYENKSPKILFQILYELDVAAARKRGMSSTDDLDRHGSQFLVNRRYLTAASNSPQNNINNNQKNGKCNINTKFIQQISNSHFNQPKTYLYNQVNIENSDGQGISTRINTKYLTKMMNQKTYTRNNIELGNINTHFLNRDRESINKFRSYSPSIKKPQNLQFSHINDHKLNNWEEIKIPFITKGIHTEGKKKYNTILHRQITPKSNKKRGFSFGNLSKIENIISIDEI